ncbi:glycoside hydrolase family 20 zincin-like fold domain-containing protein [Parablautia muri]|uniref:beta-N-acetylhexosaminidase n=1 Tax=Parablautia muri TaxID=2320879 RepID=A0A9X5GS10_9FIRM|nr:family 20 glycosylhydrolase [Parablautia muri]NBJ92696.1 glycoside hydrolase [Parablautia muri]
MYLIPEPQEIRFGEGTYTLTFDKKIVLNSACSLNAFTYGELLQKELKACTGYGLNLTKGASKKGAVWLTINPLMEEEEYGLEISEDGARIEGSGDKGLLYGVQTLRQIIRQTGAKLPFVSIHDFPQIQNRGFYHDVTRGRIPTLSYLKGLADQMAFYKMNQLQLYIEHSFLFENLSEMWRDDTPLTAQEIMELDAYCRKMNIELVPNISCFGHLYKLLRTKSYEHLCELPEPRKAPFGFYDRMAHHTIDVTNEESFTLIKSMIEEFMPLFTSEYFNIGGDETFDLGKGKSSRKAEQVGVKRLYMDFIKEICEFVVQKGKKPMFWGDIICDFPECVKELPVETICLNWGYEEDQSDESAKKLAQAGAVQYCCPGVNGWNQMVNRLDVAYENIKRMCSYAVKYHAIGVLNTDWGDYGHINHPDLGIPGRIYGAAFAWNRNIPDFEEINRRISRIEFGDKSEKLVCVLAEISHNWVFKWEDAVRYRERKSDAFTNKELIGTKEALEKLDDLADRLRSMTPGLPERTNGLVHACLVAIRGMKLIQKIGVVISARDYKTEPLLAVDGPLLAGELEEWFLFYKELWRSVSKESELYCIQDLIFWYADLLRDC